MTCPWLRHDSCETKSQKLKIAHQAYNRELEWWLSCFLKKKHCFLKKKQDELRASRNLCCFQAMKNSFHVRTYPPETISSQCVPDPNNSNLSMLQIIRGSKSINATMLDQRPIEPLTRFLDHSRSHRWWLGEIPRGITCFSGKRQFIINGCRLLSVHFSNLAQFMLQANQNEWNLSMNWIETYSGDMCSREHQKMTVGHFSDENSHSSLASQCSWSTCTEAEHTH